MADSDIAPGEGPKALSLSDSLLLLLTIFLFLLLCAVSGRILYGQYAAKRKRLLAVTTPAGEVSGSVPAGRVSYSAVPQAPPASANVVGGSESALMEEEGAAAASTGFEMRQRLFLLLFMTSTLRVCSLVTEVATLDIVAVLPSTSVYCRLLTLFLWLPSMLFVSMYGLVLLFWAQLCHACWGKARPWPRRIFFLFNVLFYVGFALLFACANTSAGLWRGCDLLQGSVFALGLFGMLYYSLRLIDFFRNQSPDEDFFFDLSSAAMANNNGPRSRHGAVSLSTAARLSPRQLVLRRITAVCILLCVLFTIKAVYLIGMGTGYMESEESQYRTPLGVHHIAYEFAIHFSTEFIPSALLLFFTRQDKTSSAQRLRLRSSSATSASASLSSGGYGANSRDKPPTPNFAYAPIRCNGHGIAAGHFYQEDAVPMLSGYQYQATQRAYGSTNTATSANLCSSNSSGAFLLDSFSGGAFSSVGPTTGSTTKMADH